jgi:predicted RNase H-like nuclease (RuvC/YqgF family)
MFHMVDAGRHKINCWVPESLWEKVEALGYDSPTKATVAGYEALIGKGDTEEEREELGNNRGNMGNNWEDMGKQLEEAQRQIKDYEEKIRTAPDPVELAKVQAHYEGLQKLLEEKDKRIESLNKEVERLDMFTHYFKSVEVKQIEAPAVEKKSLLSRLKFW